jgi:hypothetical protein
MTARRRLAIILVVLVAVLTLAAAPASATTSSWRYVTIKTSSGSFDCTLSASASVSAPDLYIRTGLSCPQVVTLAVIDAIDVASGGASWKQCSNFTRCIVTRRVPLRRGTHSYCYIGHLSSVNMDWMGLSTRACRTVTW